MTASAQTVAAGKPVTLTVTAANANTVFITDSADSTNLPVLAGGGTKVVNPVQTTTYTVTATGANNQQTTAQVTITVMSVSITATPTTIAKGSPTTLTVTAANATQVLISDSFDSTTYPLAGTGGTQAVSPSATTIYTATASDANGDIATATVNVTVNAAATVALINHVIFMMQENRSFDSYFGMLNPYRQANKFDVGDDGNTYNVDGIDDKLTTTANVNDKLASFPLFHTVSSCLDDMTSSWVESYGDVSRYDFSTTRKMLMDGFVHTAENYAVLDLGDGAFTDLAGQRAMAYYRDTSVSGTPQLNYYYYMASQFALSDRWFSPVASKSTPNRIATLTGGTTQGLVFDPFVDDKFTNQLTTQTIFQKLDSASPPVSWKIYYTLLENDCDEVDGDCGNLNSPGSDYLPVTSFSNFAYSSKYLYSNHGHATCLAPLIGSQPAVGDPSNDFCIDTTHIAPLSQFFIDAASGTLASFSYIEAGYGVNDEHPGSGQSNFKGQAEMALIIGKFMYNANGGPSASWADSVFFLSYDEDGGPYDHVPPVPGHSNDNTIIANMGYLPLGNITDISTIAVNADSYKPCVPPGGALTLHCDLDSSDPGSHSTDAPAVQGFAAQLGFRLPNMVISPFTRKHYVSHVPMDHTAILRFVEDRFIGDGKYLTGRDAVQPNLLDFFDFNKIPWATPPPVNSIPVPPAVGGTCTPTAM
jgi:phospholipase C